MATTEVAEALEGLDFLQEVNVYGVTVPGVGTGEVGEAGSPSWHSLGTAADPPPPSGHEGRAGMAALVLRAPQPLDLAQLYAHVSENLPPYAWPRFLRLQVISCTCPPTPHICRSCWSPIPKPTQGSSQNTLPPGHACLCPPLDETPLPCHPFP